jgi:N-acetylglucosaminyl-diphospho-decaprenol L-rhamnosyltransferase
MEDNAIYLSISVVSHRQSHLVRQLLSSLDVYRPPVNFEVLVTLNVSEPLPTEDLPVSYPVTIIQNSVRCGFAKNHNQAFRLAKGTYFCILNPDIIFVEPVFSMLLKDLEQLQAGILAPRIVDSHGQTQDNFRKLLTPRRMIARYFGKGLADELAPVMDNGFVYPDWIAGMFLLMRSEVFRHLGGFDERYFLYCEDVDLSIRCWLTGLPVVVDTRVKVLHEARRDSRMKLVYLCRHLRSALRFFLSEPFWQAKRGYNQLLPQGNRPYGLRGGRP